MAIYHFSAQFITRGKGQSVTAAAAYRSGEKLYSERYGRFNEYKRKSKPIVFILTPKNAPDWAKDREMLWNKVEEKERQKNAQLAREINIALPKELSFEEQEKLTREFCQKVFVDDGMVADVSIHHDDPNNPHFHVMLTLRSFDEKGEFQAKVKKIKDKNGKSIRTELTDWNSREKFSFWREQWSIFVNDSLKKNGIDEAISHKSHADLNKKELPTIHEGFVAREMGDSSDRINQNKNIIDFNKKAEEIRKLEQEVEIKKEKRGQEVVRALSPMEKKNLSTIAKELKIFISFSGINEKRKMLQRWEKSVLKDESNHLYASKLNTIENVRILAEKADDILAKEADRYLKKHYPTIDGSKYTNFAKKVLVEESFQEGTVLPLDIAISTLNQAMIQEIDETISSLMGDKIYTYHQVIKKHQELTVEANQMMLEKKANDSIYKDAARNEIIMAKGRSIASRLRGYETVKSLIEDHYSVRLKALYEDLPEPIFHQLSVSEKELIVGYTDYFGERLEMEDSDPVVGMFATGEKKKLLDLMTSLEMNKPEEMRFLRILHGNATMQQYFFAECLADPVLLADPGYKEKLASLTERSPEGNTFVAIGDTRKTGLLSDMIGAAQSSLTRGLNQLDYEEREKVQEMNRLQGKKRRRNRNRGLSL